MAKTGVLVAGEIAEIVDINESTGFREHICFVTVCLMAIGTIFVFSAGVEVVRGIDRLAAELAKFKKAIRARDRRKVEKLLESAVSKRHSLVKYKMSRKELI